MRGPRTRVALGLAASLLALLAASGCSDERTFDAEQVVAELNDAGAGLTLGDALPSNDEDVSVRVIGFAADAASAGPSGPGTVEGATAGSLVVLADAEAARAEFSRCEAALSFTCYRAANAVLRFTAIGSSRRRRMAKALRAVETKPAP